jgi:hypothetical protein
MKKSLKLNVSKKKFDKEPTDLEYTYFYEYLFDSKDIRKILIKYDDKLYIKYPGYNKRNKIFEIKYEKRSFAQIEINNLLIPIVTYKDIPVYKKLFNKFYSIYKNIGQWKIIIHIKNVYCKIYFIGIILKFYNSQYYEYLHEFFPDNYCIINLEEL